MVCPYVRFCTCKISLHNTVKLLCSLKDIFTFPAIYVRIQTYPLTLTRTRIRLYIQKKILFSSTFNFPAYHHSPSTLVPYAINFAVKHPTQYLPVYVSCSVKSCVKLDVFGYPLIIHGTFQLFLHRIRGRGVCGHLSNVRRVYWHFMVTHSYRAK
jgi:hypothetical protein